MKTSSAWVAVAQASITKLSPMMIRASENLKGVDGSAFRAASVCHRMAKTGPSSTIISGFTRFDCAALMKPGMWTEFCAIRVRDEPACSNSIQNRTEKMHSTRAASIRVRVSPFRKKADQTSMPRKMIGPSQVRPTSTMW